MILISLINLNYCRYIVERKHLDRMGTFSDWTDVYRGLVDTSLTLKDFDVEKDCLYRVRAENEFGVSDPSMCATYYGRIGNKNLLKNIFCEKLKTSVNLDLVLVY